MLGTCFHIGDILGTLEFQKRANTTPVIFFSFVNFLMKALAIVDGAVLTLPMSEAFATPGVVNDVTLVFGVMAEEIDAGPNQDLTNLTSDEYSNSILSQYEYLTKKFNFPGYGEIRSEKR